MRFLAAVVGIAAAGSALAAPVLEGIDVVGDGAAVRLHLSKPVETAAHTLTADGPIPPRIYLDFPGTTLAPEAPHVITGAGAVLRVRAGQYTLGTTRVVLDLVRAVPFDVEHDEETITIMLGTAAPSPPDVAPAPQVSAKRHPAEPPASPPPPPARADVPTPRIEAAAPREAPPREAPPREAPPPEGPSRENSSREIPPHVVAPPHEAPPAPPREAPPRLAAIPKPRPSSVTPHPLVVIDAGHGGRDPGAEGVGGVLEKDVVLDLARELQEQLAERLPVDVILTRSDDSFVPIARRLALPSERATLFISLHANSCSDPSARGFEVFYGGGAVREAGGTGTDRRAALLGRSLGRALEERIGGVRGEARPGSFLVLVRNPVPSALVEVGYLTHPDEAARFQDGEYRQQLAEALVEGVAAFLRASAPPL